MEVAFANPYQKEYDRIELDLKSLGRRVASLEADVEALKLINRKLIAKLERRLDLDLNCSSHFENIEPTCHPDAVWLTSSIPQGGWTCSLLTSDARLAKSRYEAYRERGGSKFRYELLSLTAKEVSDSPSEAIERLKIRVTKELSKIEATVNPSELLKARATLYREII